MTTQAPGQPDRETHSGLRAGERGKTTPIARPAASVEVSTQQPWLSGQQRVRFAAGLLIACGLAQAAPVLWLNDGGAPVWARVVLMIALLQVAWALWTMTVPGPSSCWTAMLLCACVAALDGCAFTLSAFTPAEKCDVLGIDALRPEAQLWVGAMLIANLALTFAYGRLATRRRN